MKKNLIVMIILSCLFWGCNYFSSMEQNETSESPERLFNLATEAMIKGEKDIAIELYYKIIEQYPDFKKYRPDALYRLGTLLFKSERFEESEKIFQQLITRYKNYPYIKDVYEKLIYIYIQELPNPAKAENIKKVYKSKFKESRKFKEIEKTAALLDSKEEKINLFKLNVEEIETKRVEKIQNYDTEFFPLQSMLGLKVYSPDKKYFVERKKINDKYFLFLTNVNKNETKKISGSENGFGQQWSWDSNCVIFTVMNWTTKERTIKLYDIKNSYMKILFTGKNIGDLLCFSPDNSKIAFWYYNNLWLISKTGKNMSMICKTVNGENVVMMSWSRDGDKILIGKNGSGNIDYYLFYLGRKELISIK
ncbi:MAG TPA: tetratricopeptide repeat protein [Candidatus Goldiibacteriota bacterium]|nr:tetratricopeptide repeat protein [Candidatus Goldiibacteriota bacterium]